MRTGRSLTVCCSLLPGGGEVRGFCSRGGRGVCSWGVCLVWGGCLLPGECLFWGGLLWGGRVCSGGCAWPGGVCSRGVPAPGGCLLWGVLLWGVSAPEGVCSRGCLLWGGIPACTEADTPPPLWTDTRLWKYYLGPTSLRPVITERKILQCTSNDRQFNCLNYLHEHYSLCHFVHRHLNNAWYNTKSFAN